MDASKSNHFLTFSLPDNQKVAQTQLDLSLWKIPRLADLWSVPVSDFYSCPTIFIYFFLLLFNHAGPVFSQTQIDPVKSVSYFHSYSFSSLLWGVTIRRKQRIFGKRWKGISSHSWAFQQEKIEKKIKLYLLRVNRRFWNRRE